MKEDEIHERVMLNLLKLMMLDPENLNIKIFIELREDLERLTKMRKDFSKPDEIF
ncbi:hypothetical protein KEJ47_07560 [Candidatus Bathyarchaeota archaeon]|nr:hypothetical protein [Candidatus Bathyarchaeota archaeon]